MQSREKIRSHCIGRSIGGFRLRCRMLKPYTKIHGQAARTPRIAAINSKVVDVVKSIDEIAHLGNARSRTLITTRTGKIVQNDVAAILRRRGYRRVLVSKTELEFVITTPILLEVVRIKRDVRLGPCGVVKHVAVFQKAVPVQAEDWLRIGADSADGIQIEIVLDIRILRIHEPVRVRDERMFELEQV